jgi:hypothetical protein
MFTLDQARARMRRAMLVTDTSEAGAGPATAAESIAALDALDGGNGTLPAATPDDTGDDAAAGDEPDPDGADELGDKGKQALERMKERLRNERAARRAAEQALAEKSGEDDAARVQREAVAKANQRILRSEIKAAAKGVVNDDALPDIFALIPKTDLDAIEVDDDGNVDEDEVAALVADLVKKKPYLAAQGGTKAPKVDPSQGAVGGAPTTAAARFAAQMNGLI